MLALVLALLGLSAELPALAPPPDGDARWQTVQITDGVTLTRAPAPGLGVPWGRGEARSRRRSRGSSRTSPISMPCAATCRGWPSCA